MGSEQIKDHKIIVGGFAWRSPDDASTIAGGSLPPRKPELRKPVLWLSRDANDLYLINDSHESLAMVMASNGGFLTVDDATAPVAGKDFYVYRDIKPNTAVKVDEYDDYYDLDYVLQVSLRIVSKSLGCIEVRSPPKKGGVVEAVLLWDSGEEGKHVYIGQCP